MTGVCAWCGVGFRGGERAGGAWNRLRANSPLTKETLDSLRSQACPGPCFLKPPPIPLGGNFQLSGLTAGSDTWSLGKSDNTGPPREVFICMWQQQGSELTKPKAEQCWARPTWLR